VLDSPDEFREYGKLFASSATGILTDSRECLIVNSGQISWNDEAM
jgi:hypothetical protein